MNSLQVESFTKLYDLLSKEDKVTFLSLQVKTDEFQIAALNFELTKLEEQYKQRSHFKLVKQMITSDNWIKQELIINPESVPHITKQMYKQFKRVKFFRKEFSVFYTKMAPCYYYIFLHFNPYTNMENVYDSSRFKIFDWEEFSVEKLDPTIGPMFWQIYDKQGFQEEIQCFPE